MSTAIIRRLSSRWLDRNDTRGNDSAVDTADVRTTEESETPQGKWETILGKMSREASLEPKECDVSEADSDNRDGDGGSSEQSEMERHLPRRKRIVNCLLCQNSTQLASYVDIGRARFISSEVLLLLRALFASALGITAGLSLGLKDPATATGLLREQFVWLHVSVLILFPFLLVASLKRVYLYSDDDSDDDEPPGGVTWMLTSVLTHTIGSLSHTELIRLFILAATPALRPEGTPATSNLYTLGSIPAVQRYLLSAASLLELVFSGVPHRLYYVLVVLAVSLSWEVAVFHSRALDQTIGIRIVFSLASVVLAIKISVLSVFVHRGLELLAFRRRNPIEDPLSVV